MSSVDILLVIMFVTSNGGMLFHLWDPVWFIWLLSHLAHLPSQPTILWLGRTGSPRTGQDWGTGGGPCYRLNVSKISVLRSPDVTQQAVFDTTHNIINPSPTLTHLSGDVLLTSFCPEGFVGIGVLPFLFFRLWQERSRRPCTDTHIYVFPLPSLTLALSVVHNKIIPREQEHEIPWQFSTTVGWGNTKSSSVDHMMILGSTGFLFWYKKTSRTKKNVIDERNLKECLPCLPLKTRKVKRKSKSFYHDNFVLPWILQIQIE